MKSLLVTRNQFLQQKLILMTKNWFLSQESHACHKKLMLVTRNQCLWQEINSFHKKSILVSLHPTVKLINSWPRVNPTKKFAWAYTFCGNLVPRFPVNSPPWSEITLFTVHIQDKGEKNILPISMPCGYSKLVSQVA